MSITNNRSVKQDVPCVLRSLAPAVNNETARSDIKSGSRDYVIFKLLSWFLPSVCQRRCINNSVWVSDITVVWVGVIAVMLAGGVGKRDIGVIGVK